MANEIKAGSVVQLKSGGPRMTVAWVDENEAYCEWFSEEKVPKVSGHTYPFTSLKVLDA
ncbi:DUF2158 domain-containing protein [Mesorhizobium sp.]|uniref:YodC family protein n=1 Tax=Mesorhizobium sp. TaxID=1871066 RepID=UPI000FD45CF1|nr:DUF2158 domain-containing protein [Mesorhizobium sp. M5C.F.Ca.IN.020.32.2.1]RUV90397.1 DUF2158 domain-containing protein [Mesorhizobium sp. M5C.F.Ca.IN.020.14.1.1]RWG38444.1 MAG: DUF2158 domain-containing protein [Mesorhizobium sp.]RWH45382.1 MAG: DUF2158 domain-containing protein [Mesorhizobium sp.]RWH55466.1 MAG: DUF2158 domain-containing protein [Mesorhizobium sp.]